MKQQNNTVCSYGDRNQKTQASYYCLVLFISRPGSLIGKANIVLYSSSYKIVASEVLSHTFFRVLHESIATDRALFSSEKC